MIKDYCMGKYSPQKNVYYLSISACQKAIRRNNPGKACLFGEIAWRIDKQAFIQRLATMMYEESGADPYVMQKWANFRHDPKDFTKIADLLTPACNGKHSRSSVTLKMFFGRNRILTAKSKEILEYANGCIPHLVVDYQKYGFPECYNEILDADEEWIIDVAEQWSHKDREKMFETVPYLLSRNAVYETFPDKYYPDEDWNGFPLYGADQHTSLGKFAVRTTLKQLKYPENPDFTKALVFKYEGCAMVNKIELTGLLDARSQSKTEENKLDVNYSFKEKEHGWFTEVFQPKLNEIRRWVLETAQEDTGFLLKNMIESN